MHPVCAGLVHASNEIGTWFICDIVMDMDTDCAPLVPARGRRLHGHRGQRVFGVSQPGVSRALARLEQEVGTPLLRRSGRVLRMTHAGTAFKRHVDHLVNDLDDGLAAVDELVDPEGGVVTLAFPLSLGSWLVPGLIRAVPARPPAGAGRAAAHRRGRERAGVAAARHPARRRRAHRPPGHRGRRRVAAHPRRAARARRAADPPAGRARRGRPGRGRRRAVRHAPGAVGHALADARPVRGGRLRADDRLRGRRPADRAWPGGRRARGGGRAGHGPAGADHVRAHPDAAAHRRRTRSARSASRGSPGGRCCPRPSRSAGSS